MENEESNTFVRVAYKQSSSSGKMGFDIVVQASKGATAEEMKSLKNLAVTTARTTRDAI